MHFRHLKNNEKQPYVVLLFFLLLSTLTACSGFKPRSQGAVPVHYQHIYLEGLSKQNAFGRELTESLHAAGITFVNDRNKASSILKISDLNANKKIIGYSNKRRVREYSVFLKFNYSTTILKSKTAIAGFAKRPLNVERTLLYDPNFLLGKTEEEKNLREEINKSAARFVLLRLKYGQSSAKN